MRNLDTVIWSIAELFNLKESDMTFVSRIVLTLVATLALQLPALANTYQEGVDYEVLPQAGKVEVPGKLEVREFFWYGCPHCFLLEGPLAQWSQQLPDDVHFIRTPAPMNSNWVPHAHAYYVAESLGRVDEISDKLFHALHVKKEKVFNQKELARFFTQFDISEDNFNKLYNSFAVRVKVRQAEALSKNYRLRGVPALVVNGKYLVKAKAGQSPEAMLPVVEFLLNRERSASTAALQ